MRPLFSVLFGAALLAGCGKGDQDQDGVAADVDCDDLDGRVGGPSDWYADADLDHHGDAAVTLNQCNRPRGYVSVADDCDDTNPQVSPSATEVCNDRDDDCDTTVDEDVELRETFADLDGDGFGDPGAPDLACTAPTGNVSNALDCDDDAADVHPGATELCNTLDDNCDGVTDLDATDRGLYAVDADGDGFGSDIDTVDGCEQPEGTSLVTGDCNDAAATVNPNGTETCDGVDENCNGSVDEAAGDRVTFWRDSDADGYGDPTHPTSACAAPSGYVDNELDCDDRDKNASPDTVWYFDVDHDGFGGIDTRVSQCIAPTDGVSTGRDCDDSDADVRPGVQEVCNGLDDDCDGYTDNEAADGTTIWYADADGDGYGDITVSGYACTAPNGFIDNGGDCDDRLDTVNPSAPEICDEADNDCDALADDEDDDVVASNIYYRDADSDGFGDLASPRAGCVGPEGYVSDTTDCDDADDDVNPGADEYCNGGADDDCDGLIDNADPSNVGDATWFADRDGDGYGAPDDTILSCGFPSGYVNDSGDCADDEPLQNPGFDEICGNGYDDDCDGSAGVCGWAGDVDLAEAGWTYQGNNSSKLGASIANASDLDLDGIDDIVIGAPYQSSQMGQAYVFAGGAAEGAYTTTSAFVTISGERSSEQFGYAVAGGYDVTGDAVRDLLIGAPLVDGSGFRNDVGAIYVIDGTKTGSILARDGYKITGANSSDYFGAEVAMMPDMNGDGIAEIAVGGGYQTYQDCDAYIFAGPITGPLTLLDVDWRFRATQSSRMGNSISWADWDGDGMTDAVIGDPGAASSRGAVYVFENPAVGEFTGLDADFELTGIAADTYFGDAVDVGDFDGDGQRDDIVAGAPDEPAAYVVFGSRSGSLSVRFADVWIHSSMTGGAVGTTVANAGDVDGDLAEDVLVGAPDYGNGRDTTGQAWLIFNVGDSGELVPNLTTTEGVARFTGANSSQMGLGLAAVGDRNGDGLSDIAIGAANQGGGTGYGMTYVFLGKGL